ncbi:MAG: patatin-like phospholipase family protein [Weeksellaceae bacterium]
MKKSKYWLIIIILICTAFKGFAQEKDTKIGLVLSGGGAKGYAHIGVLQAIEEAGVKIDYIGGTSMGAVVGALYASGYNAEQLKVLINNIDLNDAIFNNSKREQTPFFSKMNEEKYLISLEFDDLKLKLPTSISSGQGTYNILSEYLSHVHEVENFDELPTPFICIGTNLETGEQKIFKSGYLPNVVMASAAYPTLFKPIQVDGSYYVDGGVKNNYPAKEVKDMGADYLIGVDLGAGLMEYPEITNATDVIEQIISFGIEQKSEEQRGLIDLAIVPDVKEISVTNFEIKDSIMREGYKAALKLKPILDSLRKIQGYAYKKPPLERDSIFTITDINFKGLNQYSKGYILGKLGIEPYQEVSYKEILDGLSRLSATENFLQIEHKLVQQEGNHRILNLDLIEKKRKYYLRFGLHYDKLFKTSMLLNFTAKNLLSINSTLSLDAIIGDNPRFNINYFVDNGIRPSFGFNSSFYQFEIARSQEINTGDSEVSYNYDVQNFISKLYTQSTIAEKYAAGVGFEYNYSKIFTRNLKPDNPFQTIQNSYFLTPYFFLKADTRDNSFFPTKGFLVDGQLKYYLPKKHNDYDASYMLKSHVQYNQSISDHLAIQASGTLGLSFDNQLPNGFNFGIGGLYEQEIMNNYKFHGLPFSADLGNNLFAVGGAVQYKFNKKHHIRYNFDAAQIKEKSLFKDLTFTYSGHGLTYCYMSPLGPIQGSLTYSPQHGDIIPYLSLGHWF